MQARLSASAVQESTWLELKNEQGKETCPVSEYAANGKTDAVQIRTVAHRRCLMRYKEFEKLVLQHLDQYSVSGIVMPPEYNNHVDQTQRICALANIALRTIATQSAPISAVIALKDDGIKKESLPNGMTIVTMPSDFWKLTGKGFPNFENDGYARNSHFQEVAQNQIIVPTREISRTMLTYYRYPRKLHGDDDEIIDGTDMVADCASFYVASQLARHENAYAYQSLYNEYETMMARLKKPMITEYSETEDVYQFF